MEEPSTQVEPKERGSNRTERIVLIVGVLLSAVSTMAAAYSAWASQQGLAQAQDAQLVEQRLGACVELDRRATDRITDAFSTVMKGPQRWGGTYWGDYYTPVYQSCPSDPPETAAACEAAMRGVPEQAAFARGGIAELQFQSARRFDLLAAPLLAEKEEHLSVALADLSRAYAYELLIKDDRAVIETAMQAQREFRAACVEALGRFRLSE